MLDYKGWYFRDYEMAAVKTASYKDPDYLPLGLVEEVGELVHEYARCKRKGVDMDVEALKNEVGDVLWVLSQISRQHDFSLEEAAIGNIEKLKERAMFPITQWRYYERVNETHTAFIGLSNIISSCNYTDTSDSKYSCSYSKSNKMAI